jgi:cation:H+ antiporter
MTVQPSYASIHAALLALAIGLVMLSAGGEFLVAGATGLARRWGMNPLLIGLTIVAFGTSMPEFFVSLIALFQGHTDIMIGNVIGSNIANIGLILGLCALLSPLPVKYKTVKTELHLVLAASLALFVIAWYGTFARLIGLVFVAALLLYTCLAYRVAIRRKNRSNANDSDRAQKIQQTYTRILFLMICGFLLLGWGSDVFISAAVDVARYLGVPELVIGLTLTAVGTSLPELSSCLAALRHRQSGLLVGNIIGSNLFNILMVLGCGAVARPYTLSPNLLIRDLPVMFGFSALLIPILANGHKLKRWHGLLFLAAYGSYIILLV